MTSKFVTNSFNNTAPKDSDLLPRITRARKMLEVSPSLNEAVHALTAVRHACEILSRRTGVEYTQVDLSARIKEDKEAYPQIAGDQRARTELYADKNASEACGLLFGLLTVNDKNEYVLGRMDNKHRLTVCKRAEATLAWSIVLQLRSLRDEKPKKAPAVKK